jgi:hypothetical protein
MFGANLENSMCFLDEAYPPNKFEKIEGKLALEERFAFFWTSGGMQAVEAYFNQICLVLNSYKN